MKKKSKATQEFRWVPAPTFDPKRPHADRRTVTDMPNKPVHVWTLYSEPADQSNPSEFKPVHSYNAHLEDVGHDWNWRNGTLTYFSRVSSPRHGVWLLIQYT